MATVDDAAVKKALSAFRDLPKEASQALREESQGLSKTLARSISAAGARKSRQDALAAKSVRAAKDRLPAIRMGGTKKVGRNRVPVHKVMYGSEFGSNHLRQFRRHRGNRGYWFYPTVYGEHKAYLQMWERVADRIFDEWTDYETAGIVVEV